MKAKTIFAVLIVASMLLSSVGFAHDDGPLFKRNVSKTPEQMTGASQMSVLHLYVPAQSASSEVLSEEGILYPVGDECTASDPTGCTIVDTMYEAKPLIATYNDGVGEVELGTGTGFGQRDAFAALSLDDGHTWKNYNLSNAADKSSFVLRNGQAYPGDVFRMNHVVVGNRIAVAWISRYCESGSPLYSWEDDEKDAFLTLYPELANPVNVDGEAEPYELYTDDLFGVAGSQGSVDYTLQGFPEVGEIPYGCLWVARGTLEQVDEEGNYLPLTAPTDLSNYDIIWRQAERLTSGRRDANRVDITGTGGAGFIVSWQEDPDGLRPGKGLGPGEGWSGAIANSKTDIWYSYIAWDDFDDVCLLADEPVGACTQPGELSESTIVDDAKPKITVPFAAPMRLTDNSQCKGIKQYATDGSLMNPYCYADLDQNGTYELCTTSVSWTNPGGTTLDVCQTEDGRVLTGRTASTRVRWAIKPYTNPDGITSAWVIMAEEKMKAMGTELTDPNDPESDPIDIGKDMWYHTFEWNNPELVLQGLMLNAPAIDHETGEMFPVYVDEWENDYYETEIARRFNLMVQGIGAAMASESKTSAVLLYKEGILFQGGPADIFTRRVVIPEPCLEDGSGGYVDDDLCFNPQEDNPFAYDNVVCDTFGLEGDAAWVVTPEDENPNYVKGLCGVQGMNVSGTVIISCDDGTGGDACADSFPWDADEDESGYPKVTEWRQCDGIAAIDGCTESTLDDTSWANPYDVSKGHRGFIDGDFVMMMYATAPNWKANTTGNEAYNLYVRRSFDGGQTWTTLPADFPVPEGIEVVADGTETCEDYGWGGQVEEETCTFYAAGEFEQARNVSRLTGSRITTLDPRYSPTGGMLKLDYSNLVCDDDGDGVWENCGDTEADYPLLDVRDPSAYFMTYETGDNTAVTVETGAVPMDMYYSKATNFGDDYDEQDVCDGGLLDEDAWYPNADCTDGEPDLRWDWLENGEELATEASVYADPAGTRFYAVWNQELEISFEHFADMDSEFRRMYWNLTDVDVSPTASILYVSTDKAAYDDEDIVLIGTGRDRDNLGDGDEISNVRWQDDLTGQTFNERTWKFPPRGLIPGHHSFSFQAQDNEGNWSQPKMVSIWIAEQFYDTYLPLVTR